jgi:hypothetical protein
LRDRQREDAARVRASPAEDPGVDVRISLASY